MKKRLLSAALALAMVLTLLPMSAFAATEYDAVANASTATSESDTAQNPVGKSFTYQTATTYANGIIKEQGKWYWSAPAKNDHVKTYVADSGFIIGVGNSGAWYPDGSTYESKVTGTTAPSSFTLLGTAPTFTRNWPTTLDIDVNGNTFSLTNLDTCGANGDQGMTKIKVTDRSYKSGGTRASVTIPTTDRSTYNSKTASSVTIEATNVNVGAINLKGYGNNVTLNNCEATTIDLDGTTVNSAGNTTYTAQQLKTSNSTTTGKITIVGNGSTVNLQDTIGGGAVDVTSDAGSVTIGGYSNIGAVTVKNKTADTGAIPTVTVNGGTVNGIDTTGSSTTASSAITINRTTNDINISGEIKTNKGTVNITQANTKAITVGSGSLSIAGSKINIGGTVTLGAQGGTDLSISATNSTFTGFTVAAGNESNLNIKNWPATRDNYYGTLTLNKYSGKGIKGGTFAAATGTSLGQKANMNWVDNVNLQFIVPIKTNAPDTGAVALYGRDELTEAISSIAATAPVDNTNDVITVIGQGAPGDSTLQLNFGGNPWAYIKYSATTGIKLPTRINNTGVSKWIVKNGSETTLETGASVVSGVEKNFPATKGTLILDATDTMAEATSITNAALSKTTGTVNNQNIRVELNGNTIHLSGAVEPDAGGVASVYVDLITNVVDSTGEIQKIKNVMIDYNVNTKAVSFNEFQLSLEGFGAVVQDGALILNRGTGAKYTVTANLAVSAGTLGLQAPADGSPVVVTVGGRLSSWSNEAKKQLIDSIESDDGFAFNTSGKENKAMLEAINAAQATITNDTSVTNWIASARDYIWKNGSPDSSLNLGKHTGNWKDFATINNAKTDYEAVRDNYNKAFIVPYLVVNVTDYNSASGTMTATLTPYYRVDVSKDGAYSADAAYTVQAGRALSALTGDMSNPITVDLGIDSLKTKMHQDGKYVYTGTSGSWDIYHAGTTGLGTVEINADEALVEISDTTIDGRVPAKADLGKIKYDTLQAAIDDTKPGATQQNSSTAVTSDTFDTITVNGNYKGDCTFTMTGYARKVRVIALGDLPIKCSSQNVDTQNPSGYTYDFQLKKDTAPTGGNITIASATGGTASVSSNPAAAGSTVTVTLSASAGYTPSGVTVKTSGGQSVSVSGSGSTYTFTMPSGTVTVTPSFTQTQTVTNATVSVSNPNRGSGTAATSVGSNRVAPGTTVTVSTTPGSGQRTMGLNVTGATAYRTGENQFTFTVPSGYSNVVVTPTFDAQNGTSFSDVWSTEYFSPAVAWAVGRGITNGTSTYTFGSYNSCTREDMVTFLYRAAGSPAVGNVRNPFWDVQPGSYYYNAVMWAVSKGITNGVSATQFGVGQNVTRAQAVTFLYRYNGSPAASTNSGFYDVPSSEYFAKAVSWANATGVTNGTSTTAFSPNLNCQRAQIVSFLYRNATGVRA